MANHITDILILWRVGENVPRMAIVVPDYFKEHVDEFAEIILEKLLKFKITDVRIQQGVMKGVPSEDDEIAYVIFSAETERAYWFSQGGGVKSLLNIYADVVLEKGEENPILCDLKILSVPLFNQLPESLADAKVMGHA